MIQCLANFYATFFTTRFIPPRYDPANDIAHGIAPRRNTKDKCHD